MGQKDFTSGWELTQKIQLLEIEGTKKVIVKGNPYMEWQNGDEVAERMAIVQLYNLGIGTQEELSEIFQIHVNTIAKYISAYTAEGGKGLLSSERGPKEKWKVTPDVRAKILLAVLKDNIREYAAIQERLREFWNIKVSHESIRQVLIENGIVEERIRTAPERQKELFGNSGEQLNINLPFGNPSKNSDIKSLKEIKNGNPEINDDFKDRSYYSSLQREYLEQLEQGLYSTYAGGLLFVPLLKKHNFLPTIKKVIEIENQSGYSLKEICQTLFFFDVFRFETMENFKTVYPEEFGILTGKPYSPSVRTLRRFLDKAMELKKGEELMEEFAKEYLKSGLAKWGTLYIDGHFMPYYGILTISKGWHAVRAKAMKGTYNFLAVDEKFVPLLFLIRSSSEDLLDKIPEMILKVKKIAKEIGISEENINAMTVIFDREGYCAELFRILSGYEGKDYANYRAKFITWAKYSDRWVNEIDSKKFNKNVEVIYEKQKPKKVKYFETERRMNKYDKIRTIVIEKEKEGKRTAIYTNIGYSGFSAVEFKDGSAINELIKVIGKDFDIKGKGLKALNDFLETPGFYSKWKEKYVNVIDISGDDEIQALLEEEKLRDSQIKRLNRLLIENTYPQKSPKSPSTEDIVNLLLRRWGEENLIKELSHKHQIEYSPGYTGNEMEIQPMVKNPEVEELKQKISNLKRKITRIKSEFGGEVYEEMKKKTDKQYLKEIEKKHKSAKDEIQISLSQINLLEMEVDKLPKEIRFDEAHGKKMMELDYERKRFLDCIKTFTCNMEKKMCDMLARYYDKKEEIKPVLAMIVRRGGNVKLEEGVLKVRMRKFSKNPGVNYAARHLCEDLNKMGVRTLDKYQFPIHYGVEQ